MKVLAIYNRIVFIAPCYAGGSIIIAELTHYDNNDIDKDIIHNSYKEAHKAAHLHIMSESDYLYLFELPF